MMKDITILSAYHYKKQPRSGNAMKQLQNQKPQLITTLASVPLIFQIKYQDT